MPYKLSTAEAQLYRAVTDCVHEEFNRAEELPNDERRAHVLEEMRREVVATMGRVLARHA